MQLLQKRRLRLLSIFLIMIIALTWVRPVQAKTTVAAPKLKLMESDICPSLSWSSVKGATGYRLYRKVGDGDYEKVITTKKKTYKDESFKASRGENITYVVKAYKKKGGKTYWSKNSNKIKWIASGLSDALSQNCYEEIRNTLGNFIMDNGDYRGDSDYVYTMEMEDGIILICTYNVESEELDIMNGYYFPDNERQLVFISYSPELETPHVFAKFYNESSGQDLFIWSLFSDPLKYTGEDNLVKHEDAIILKNEIFKESSEMHLVCIAINKILDSTITLLEENDIDLTIENMGFVSYKH